MTLKILYICGRFLAKEKKNVSSIRQGQTLMQNYVL